ncbi:uncharacterized protein LOC122385364 [Amphibalanus amphitrite]|uniref:uncharacterized protein LOC122385364 n=1 Tax=Amphibalanus amphitrite TaxID=1232801 RepID=UPI001C90000F|nr:uncharacterized protein LOC122385364 [Amphibalanus amphitrite]
MELLSVQVGLREKFSEGLKTWLAGIMAQTECRREDAAETLLRLIDQEEVIIRDEEGAAYPHAQEAPEREWSVLVERTEVARCSTLEEALLLVGVSFYVFNQKPRTKYKTLVWFLHNEVFGMRSDEIKPKGAALQNLLKCKPQE